VSRALRVVVLSRHALVRAGLIQLLTNDDGGTSVIEEHPYDVHPRSYDVAVYDLAGPTDSVRADLAVLLAERIPVVALAPHARRDLAEDALAMGVADIVHLDITAGLLRQTLERVSAGQTTTPEAYRRRCVEDARPATRLTNREITVLELVGTGLSNRDIADRLYLSINSVKTYIRSAYRKIGVSRRAEAVLWVVRHDLGTPSG